MLFHIFFSFRYFSSLTKISILRILFKCFQRMVSRMFYKMSFFSDYYQPIYFKSTKGKLFFASGCIIICSATAYLQPKRIVFCTLVCNFCLKAYKKKLYVFRVFRKALLSRSTILNKIFNKTAFNFVFNRCGFLFANVAPLSTSYATIGIYRKRNEII